MASSERRAVATTPMSTTTIAVIITGVGVVMLCLLTALIFLLVRAVRAHKRLLADMDERGISMAEAHKEANRVSVAKPRAVLRRNVILPFNKSSGWGTLPSTDTFSSADSGPFPAHYVPPMPANGGKKNSHLSWPFSTHRMSSQSMQMKKLKGSRLSTVMESPKSSSMQSILDSSHTNASGQSLAMSSRQSSCQSLLQHHPAFRHQHQSTGRPGTATRGIIHGNNRLQRAQSFVEFPTAQMARPHIRARSASLCGQPSGMRPDMVMPPLPLELARFRSEIKSHGSLRRAPSNLSVSSFGSAHSAIPANRSSPNVTQPAKFRGQKITKPNTKGSSFAGGRTIRDTLDLRSKVLGGRCPTETDSPPKRAPSLDKRELQADRRATLMEELSSQLFESEPKDQALYTYSLPASNTSPLRPRSAVTPKRRPKTSVTSSGSPERQCQSLTNMRMAGVMRSPKRQHSQTSSRSSGGNPFQWDPTPVLVAGKPSALKGSPGARKEHGRKNSVRISLVPIFHGPPSREKSHSLPDLHRSYTAEGVATGEKNGLGLGLENSYTIPARPTTSSFTSDSQFTATSLRGSFSKNSMTLPLIEYDQPFVVFPTDQVFPQSSEKEPKHLSTGSLLSLSRFPVTPSVIEPDDVANVYSKESPSHQNKDYSGNWVPDTPLLQQYPFGIQTPDRSQTPSPTKDVDVNKFDPAQTNSIYQTPPNTNATSRSYQSAFAPIPEESSICSSRNTDVDQSRNDDSSLVSSKALSPPRLTFDDRSAFNLPVHATCIPEESPSTNGPSHLNRDSFSILNSDFSIPDDSIFGTHRSNRMSLEIPLYSNSIQSMYDSPLEALYPATSPVEISNDSPTIGHQSELSISVYSFQSPSPPLVPSPVELPGPEFPCSPRPSHAKLPGAGMALNFADVPKLHPSPLGPRGSPPRPLRSSIAKLRRMNSDAAEARNAKAGRGERRYLRLGREDSVTVPGDESWLDDLDDDTNELDEADGQRLVDDVSAFDEGHTVLDLDEGNTTLDSFCMTCPSYPPQLDIFEQDTTAGASPSSTNSHTNIWQDADKFWTSPSPACPSSPSPPKPYQPLPSSPVRTPALAPSSSSPKTPRPARKRHYEVSKDDIPNQRGLHHQSIIEEENSPSPGGKWSGKRNGVVGPAWRKRDILGRGSPNEGVRIQVTSPGGRVVTGGFGEREGGLRGLE